MSEAQQNIGERIQCINSILMEAAMHFLLGRHARGLRELKRANVDLTALRVAAERVAGPVKLPPVKRKPHPKGRGR